MLIGLIEPHLEFGSFYAHTNIDLQVMDDSHGDY